MSIAKQVSALRTLIVTAAALLTCLPVAQADAQNLYGSLGACTSSSSFERCLESNIIQGCHSGCSSEQCRRQCACVNQEFFRLHSALDLLTPDGMNSWNDAQQKCILHDGEIPRPKTELSDEEKKRNAALAAERKAQWDRVRSHGNIRRTRTCAGQMIARARACSAEPMRSDELLESCEGFMMSTPLKCIGVTAEAIQDYIDADSIFRTKDYRFVNKCMFWSVDPVAFKERYDRYGCAESDVQKRLDKVVTSIYEWRFNIAPAVTPNFRLAFEGTVKNLYETRGSAFASVSAGQKVSGFFAINTELEFPPRESWQQDHIRRPTREYAMVDSEITIGDHTLKSTDYVIRHYQAAMISPNNMGRHHFAVSTSSAKYLPHSNQVKSSDVPVFSLELTLHPMDVRRAGLGPDRESLTEFSWKTPSAGTVGAMILLYRDESSPRNYLEIDIKLDFLEMNKVVN